MRGVAVGPRRRDFLEFSLGGLAAAALHGLMNGSARGALVDNGKNKVRPVARAKRAVHICLVGGLSQVDSFDHKPEQIGRAHV